MIPAEPPVGTWVRDQRGYASVRNRDGWAPAPTGWYGCGRWDAMWEAHGPLEVCGPWGASLEVVKYRLLDADGPLETVSTLEEVGAYVVQQVLAGVAYAVEVVALEGRSSST